MDRFSDGQREQDPSRCGEPPPYSLQQSNFQQDSSQAASCLQPDYPVARYLPPDYREVGYPDKNYIHQDYPCQGYPMPGVPQGYTASSPIPEQDTPPDYESNSVNQTELQFLDKAIRRAFLRKVYLTLMLQLLVTVGIICMFLYWTTLNGWIRENSWFTFAMFPAIFVLIIILSCCEGVRRKVPLNFIILFIFTILEGVMLGAVSVYFGAEPVMWAIGATAFVSFGLTIFALQSKWDFTMWTGTLFVVILVIIAFGFLCAIIQSFWLQIVYASIGTLLFAIYLVVDTQLMLGGKHRYALSPEEYIFASLNLYLDIINLFLFILQIIGLSR